MKRKLLSVLLTLSMIVCLCGAMALTSYAEILEVNDATTLIGAVATDGEYKLTGNITLDSTLTIEAGKTVTIDLNGHVLKGNGSSSVITNYGNLTIEDSGATTAHYFTYSTDGAWTYYGDDEPVSGDIDTINTIDEDTDYVKVLGGVITGGCSIRGGGVNNEGTFTFEGGTITGNNAEEGFGGGVFSNGTMTVKNAVTITGNTTGSTTKTASNLAVVKNHPITLDTFTGSIGINLTEKISETYEVARGAFTTNGTEEDAKYFSCDDDDILTKIKFVEGDGETTSDHIELVDRVVPVTAETGGIIPENISLEEAKKIAAESGLGSNARVIYSRTENKVDGYDAYKVIKFEGGNWVRDYNLGDRDYGLETIKDSIYETRPVYVIGVTCDECKGEATDTNREGYVKSVSLSIGEASLGNVEITPNIGDGYNYWLIQDKNEGENKDKYLYTNQKTNQIEYAPSELPATNYSLYWHYDGKHLYTERTTTVRTKILFFYRTKTVVERFYLTADGNVIGISKTAPNVDVKIMKTYNDHNYLITASDSKTHTWTCKHCGDTYTEEHLFEGDKCSFCNEKKNYVGGFQNIQVSIETKVVSRKLADIIKGKNKAYTVKITPYGDEGVYATDIQYSLNGQPMVKGDSFVTYASEFELDVQITDNNGTITNWHYSTKDQIPERR